MNNSRVILLYLLFIPFDPAGCLKLRYPDAPGGYGPAFVLDDFLKLK